MWKTDWMEYRDFVGVLHVAQFLLRCVELARKFEVTTFLVLDKSPNLYYTKCILQFDKAPQSDLILRPKG